MRMLETLVHIGRMRHSWAIYPLHIITLLAVAVVAEGDAAFALMVMGATYAVVMGFALVGIEAKPSTKDWRWLRDAIASPAGLFLVILFSIFFAFLLDLSRAGVILYHSLIASIVAIPAVLIIEGVYFNREI